MPLISPTLPADGETIEAADVNDVFEAILDLINGGIDADNIEAGALSWASLTEPTAEIPATAMEDEGSLVTFRSDAGIAFVRSGMLWSDQSGLDGAMTGGTMYSSNGEIVTVVAIATKTFTASKDTYVSVSPTGTVSYQEVANDATRPALTTGYLWLAKVVTDGTEITSVTDLRQLTPSQAILSSVYPVGSVYINAAVDTDPFYLLGFGTWAEIGEGKVLVGQDTGDTSFDVLGETGGAKTHTLTSAEMPSHTHTQNAHSHAITDPQHDHLGFSNGSETTVGSADVYLQPNSSLSLTAAAVAPASTGITINNATATNQNTGGGGAHNNLQPYIVVKMWQRTA